MEAMEAESICGAAPDQAVDQTDTRWTADKPDAPCSKGPGRRATGSPAISMLPLFYMILYSFHSRSSPKVYVNHKWEMKLWEVTG